MNFCPICYYDIYLDVDEPHIIRCMLKYAIEVRFVGEKRWWRWTNPDTKKGGRGAEGDAVATTTAFRSS